MDALSTLKATEAQKRARRPFPDPRDQAEFAQEQMRAFGERTRGGVPGQPEDQVQYEARRKAVRERLKRLHENRMAADGQ